MFYVEISDHDHGDKMTTTMMTMAITMTKFVMLITMIMITIMIMMTGLTAHEEGLKLRRYRFNAKRS